MIEWYSKRQNCRTDGAEEKEGAGWHGFQEACLSTSQAVLCAAHRPWNMNVLQGGDFMDFLLPTSGAHRLPLSCPWPMTLMHHRCPECLWTSSSFHSWKRHSVAIKGNLKPKPMAERSACYEFVGLLVTARITGLQPFSKSNLPFSPTAAQFLSELNTVPPTQFPSAVNHRLWGGRKGGPWRRFGLVLSIHRPTRLSLIWFETFGLRVTVRKCIWFFLKEKVPWTRSSVCSWWGLSFSFKYGDS